MEPRPLFAFAGIWRRHQGPIKKDDPAVVIDVFSFMTTAPNALVATVNHERMPVSSLPGVGPSIARTLIAELPERSDARYFALLFDGRRIKNPRKQQPPAAFKPQPVHRNLPAKRVVGYKGFCAHPSRGQTGACYLMSVFD